MKRKRQHVKFGKKGGKKSSTKNAQPPSTNRLSSSKEPNTKRRKVSHFLECVGLPFSATKEAFMGFLQTSNFPFTSIRFPVTPQKTTVGHAYIEVNDAETKKSHLNSTLFFNGRKIKFIEPYRSVTALQLNYRWRRSDDSGQSESSEWEKFFSDAGKIKEFHFFRHNRSAYITFENIESVDRSVELFHRKSVSQVRNSGKKKMKGNIPPPPAEDQLKILRGKLPIRFTIYVSGYKFGTSKKDLVEIFKDCGKINKVLIQHQHAFITFEEEESLDIAVGKNGLVLEERDEDEDDDEKEGEEEEKGPRKLVVEIKLGKSGIMRKQMSRQRRRNRLGGDNKAKGEEQQQEKEGEDTRGRRRRPNKRSDGPHQFEGGKSVFVGNLSFSITDEQTLRDFFKTCGTILHVKLLKGFAFVQFQDDMGVRNAIKLHQSEFEGRMIHVERKKSKRR